MDMSGAKNGGGLFYRYICSYMDGCRMSEFIDGFWFGVW
ncbi:Uncharacterized protein ChrSV_3147 [Chromobacterium vaccinii]|nr:Uncharacterized protein ChrSW_3147 [Chromobacterium vaccinii]QND90604.1 Uncharacterized protein ChrSV_3147 [Chromobacterium vaccinii]